MMDHRRVIKKKPENLPKEPVNASTLEISFSNPEASNQSLLIHEDQDDLYDIFADNNNGQQIPDSDLPFDKLNILNNPNYFKQLSLSFYGTSRPAQRSNTDHTDNHSVLKTEGCRAETSNSPNSQKDYYVGKRPNIYKKLEKDSFQLNFSSFTKSFQKPQLSLSTSKIGLQPPKGRMIPDKDNVKEYINFSKADFKPFRINHQPNTNLAKHSVTRIYPQLASGANSNTMLSAKTSGRTGFFERESISSIGLKESRRPSIKDSISTKLKPRNPEYLLTEPNTCALKPSKSSTVVPKRLKMYALDNLGALNSRNLTSGEGRLPSNRSISRDKIPVRPSISKRIEEIVPKRTIAAFKKQRITRNPYYE